MHPKYWKRKALNHVLREEAGEGSAGGGALDIGSAAAAFAGLSAPAEEQQAEAKPAPETEEQAAEQLAQDEAQAETEQTDENAEPQTFKIKVDGKEVELTESELAEHYKNGLRQKDYTQKTMAAAEETKAAAAEKEKAKAERDNYAQKLQHFAIQANGELQRLGESLTEELLRNDPVEYLAQERIFKERQAQLSQAQQELQQIDQQQKQEHEQAIRSYQANQLEALHAKVPEWKDSAKFDADAKQIKKFLGEQGFAAEDIAQLGDHRLVLLARDAMQFHELKAKAREAVKKVQAAPAKVEKPGNSQVAPTDGRTRAMKQLGETGSLRDAAAVFAAFRSN